MLSRWQGGLGALVVTLVACALVILDLADDGLRHWRAEHALTTGIVSGLLVLLITVLVADQVVRLRQINERSRVVAAQAAIVTTQAVRASHAISQILTDSGHREAAGDEFRTYMMMLLVAAPVLIDAKTSRAFPRAAGRRGAGPQGRVVAAAPGARSGDAERRPRRPGRLTAKKPPGIARPARLRPSWGVTRV